MISVLGRMLLFVSPLSYIHKTKQPISQIDFLIMYNETREYILYFSTHFAHFPSYQEVQVQYFLWNIMSCDLWQVTVTHRDLISRSQPILSIYNSQYFYEFYNVLYGNFSEFLPIFCFLGNTVVEKKWATLFSPLLSEIKDIPNTMSFP